MKLFGLKWGRKNLGDCKAKITWDRVGRSLKWEKNLAKIVRVYESKTKVNPYENICRNSNYISSAHLNVSWEKSK